MLQRQLDTKQKELFELRKELEKQAVMLSMDAEDDKRRSFERKTRGGLRAGRQSDRSCT